MRGKRDGSETAQADRVPATACSSRDRCARIEQIYGKAESRSPSVKGSDKLELYLYTFDWAGPDVPQVMEVSCDAASQTVAEITLAASSL